MRERMLAVSKAFWMAVRKQMINLKKNRKVETTTTRNWNLLITCISLEVDEAFSSEFT